MGDSDSNRRLNPATRPIVPSLRRDSHSRIGLKKEGHRLGDALRPLRLAIGKLNHIGFTKSKTDTTGLVPIKASSRKRTLSGFRC